jgi:hypothetical protein
MYIYITKKYTNINIFTNVYIHFYFKTLTGIQEDMNGRIHVYIDINMYWYIHIYIYIYIYMCVYIRIY